MEDVEDSSKGTIGSGPGKVGKKRGKDPLGDFEDDSKKKKSKKEAVDDRADNYNKLTHHEHVLRRPDTYCGSTQMVRDERWILDEEQGNKKFVKKTLTFCPALYKIFDEILVNACDHLTNSPEMDYIRVFINKDAGYVSVENNGKGVPVLIKKDKDENGNTYEKYVPNLVSLIF